MTQLTSDVNGLFVAPVFQWSFKTDATFLGDARSVELRHVW
jgi:hypothetical protein